MRGDGEKMPRINYLCKYPSRIAEARRKVRDGDGDDDDELNVRRRIDRPRSNKLPRASFCLFDRMVIFSFPPCSPLSFL